MDYIFDISQTVSRNRDVNEVNLWRYDKEAHRDVLKEMITSEGHEESESTLENIFSLSRLYGDEKIDSLMNELIRERDEDWIHLAEDENGLVYNKYFVDHPEQVLGTMREVSGRFGKTLTCEPITYLGTEINMAPLKDRLEIAGERISKDARYEEIELLDDEITSIPATDDVKNLACSTAVKIALTVKTYN